jgi:signal transduction histidine kinase
MNGDNVQIMVQDDGIGMTAEDKEKLFKLDTKNSRRGTENESGTGLGLILVHEFIRRNNGSLDIESEEGKGSIFTISLPAGIRKIPDIS